MIPTPPDIVVFRHRVLAANARRDIGAYAARVGNDRVVRPSVKSRPVQGILKEMGHGGSKADHKSSVPGIGQSLGFGYGLSPSFVLVSLAFTPVSAASISVRTIGDENGEFLPAGGGAIGGFLGHETKFGLVQR